MLRSVLIVEDHPICVAALTMAAHAYDSAIEVESLATLKEARERISQKKFDAILLDLGLKDSQGLANVSVLHSVGKAVPILVVSSNDSLLVMARARALGASGFLSKAAPMSEMTRAISAVMNGETYFIRELESINEGDAEEAAIARLSPAQTKVMVELAQGHANKIIAYELGLSEATVKSHLSAIFKALGVSNRAQAILALKAQDLGE